MKFLNSNRGKQLLLLTFLFFSLSLVSATVDTQEVDDVFKVNSFVNYAKPCFNNGSYCSNAATCNYTFFNPDNSILIDNKLGTNQGAYYNISLFFPETGIYKIDQTCIDVGRKGAETFYAEVTGDGFHNTIWFYVLVLVISVGIMLLGFKLLDAWIVILGTFGLYFLGIYILRFGLVGIKDLVTTWAIGIIILAVAGYISVKSGIEFINNNS